MAKKRLHYKKKTKSAGPKQSKFKQSFKSSFERNYIKSSNIPFSRKFTYIVVGLLLLVSPVFIFTQESQPEETTAINSTNSESSSLEEVDSVNQLHTGKYELSENGETVDITLVVNRDHNFEEIWANYSDVIRKLNSKAGIVDQPTELSEDETYETHVVNIPRDKLKTGKRYFYQAIGRTFDGETLYGPIVRFTAP